MRDTNPFNMKTYVKRISTYSTSVEAIEAINRFMERVVLYILDCAVLHNTSKKRKTVRITYDDMLHGIELAAGQPALGGELRLRTPSDILPVSRVMRMASTTNTLLQSKAAEALQQQLELLLTLLLRTAEHTCEGTRLRKVDIHSAMVESFPMMTVPP